MTHQNMHLNDFIPGIVVSLLLVAAVFGQAPTQCYPGLGCFPNGPPWTSPGRPVPPPQNPDAIGTQVYCYSRASPQRIFVSVWPQVILNGCPISSSKRVVGMTHGFAQDGNATWLDMMKDEYLKAEDVVVLIVDWGPGAKNFNYLQIVSNARIVGAEIGRLLRKIYEPPFRVSPGQVHLIGFSVGAHVFAYASNQANTVFWLTGLDAAQPGFEGENVLVRLDKSDATFVDLIHTNGKPFIPQGGFGYVNPNGHVDIYANGGRDQPGCPAPSSIPQITSLSDLATVTPQVLLQIVFCSHARSFMYYIYAIRNCTILARQTTFSFSMQIASAPIPQLVTVGSDEDCTPQTCTTVGLKTPFNPARGVFAANTTDKPPYCGSPGDTSIIL